MQPNAVGHEQSTVVDPTCRRDMAGELPMRVFGVQAFGQNVEPEQLAPRGVPKRPFAKGAFGIVKNHDLASSYAATISLARAAMSAVVIPGL